MNTFLRLGPVLGLDFELDI